MAQSENVRAALALVSSGEAPYGIVYASDAVADGCMTVVGTFPADSHIPIVYPAALLTGAADDADRASLAAAVIAFPLMVRAIRLAIEAVDIWLEQAASTLGAPRLWVFATFTLPLILPGILTGAILAFAKAMGEFGATITFVSNIPGQTQTLPSAIYTFLQVPGRDAQAFRLVLVAIAIAMLALFLSEWVSRAVAHRISGQ